MPREDDQESTAMKGQLEQDQHPAKKAQPGQACQDGTARTGKRSLDSQDRTPQRRQPGQDRTVRAAPYNIFLLVQETGILL